MTWRDNLQKASFRGVAFEVDTEDGTFGRRGTLHEFPQRDKPYREDMGRKARGFSLVGFVIGDDYMAKRDALLAAVEKEGAGELVHPWYGRMMVSVQDDVRVSHSHAEGGMCRFNLSFIESGEIAFPSSGIATGTQSIAAVNVLEQAAIADFASSFSVDSLPDFAVQDAVSTVSDALSLADSALGNLNVVLRDPIGALQADLGDLVRNPLTLATRMFGILNKSSSLIDAVGNIGVLNFMRVFSVLNLSANFPSRTSTAATPTRTAMLANYNATQTLMRRVTLVQAAGMVANMSLPVYDDALSLKSKLLTALDDEAAVANDDVYLALNNVRSKAFIDVNAKIKNSARINTVQPKEVTPALVLAYDLYEDVARESEIVSRNKLRHPGFTPAIGIKVLSV